MKDSKFLLLTIVVLVALNICSLGYLLLNSHRPPMGPPPPRERVVEMMIDRLELSKEQASSVRELHDEHESKIEEINQADHRLHNEYFDMIAISPVDTMKVNMLADSMAQYRKQIELLTFNYFVAIRNVCSDSQKQRFEDIMHDALRSMGPPGPPRR